ncbi:MAG: hypothetical protein EOP11_14875, partial [Proteobacteria bacterium]
MKQVFINLPVSDLSVTVKFFTELGFAFDARYTNEKATCMVVEENIFVMLLVRDFFQSFTSRPVVDATKATEVLIALSAASREEVDHLVDRAMAAGAGTVRATEDLGFMYGRSFSDPDGHIWECAWMNPE